MSAARRQAADLKMQVAARRARLTDDRQVATDAPVPMPDALDRSHAVSRLRAAIGQVTGAKGCVVEEFHASTEEAPYLTSYAADSKDPGWMQVPIRATISGRATKIATSLADLRTLDVPFEVDSVELTRRSTDNTGMATVVAQLTLRLLVYKGEA